MRNLLKCRVALRAVLGTVIALAAVILPEYAFADPEGTKIHSFWVDGSASVTVKANQAILIMVIHGTGPDLQAALEDNTRITQQAYDALIQRTKIAGGEAGVDESVKCSVSGKRKYETEREALATAAHQKSTGEAHQELRAYRCNWCGAWHLTKNTGKAGKDSR